MVARARGIKVNSITLFLFGGVASIATDLQTPAAAFQVAIAGPVVSIFLFGLLFSFDLFLSSDGLLHFLVADLARINLVLALFNLIPGLPLDGGQVLKALIWKITGARLLGVLWAARAGKIVAWLGICLGLFSVFATGEVGGISIGAIAWFILRNAKNYEGLSAIQKYLLNSVAADAMNREFSIVNANFSLQYFADNYLLSEPNNKLYFAASDGRYRGLITKADLQLVPSSQWETQNLAAIARPLTEISTVQETTSLVEVIEKLEVVDEAKITVLSPAGGVSGVIDRADIVRVVARDRGLNISEAELNTIKTEKIYPATLQLAAIAKAIED